MGQDIIPNPFGSGSPWCRTRAQILSWEQIVKGPEPDLKKLIFFLTCFPFLLKTTTVTEIYLLTSETEDKDKNYRDFVLSQSPGKKRNPCWRKRLLLITKKRKSSGEQENKTGSKPELEKCPWRFSSPPLALGPPHQPAQNWNSPQFCYLVAVWMGWQKAIYPALHTYLQQKVICS